MTADATSFDENSKRTRIEPFFSWLRENGAPDWPQRFLSRAEGLAVTIQPGRVVRLAFDEEERRPASPARLAWMIVNAERLAPRDGRRWREYRTRVTDNPRRDLGLALLEEGRRDGIDRKLILEGATCADCFIECEHAVIWSKASGTTGCRMEPTGTSPATNSHATSKRRPIMRRNSTRTTAW